MVRGWGAYRDLLRTPRYLLFEASATAAGVGYSVFAISIPWLAYRLTGSFLLVGLTLFVETGIYTLTFLVAPFVDRARNKRTVFLLCYPAQAVAAGLLSYGIAEGVLGVAGLLALVAFISFLWDFAWAAGNIVPRLLLTEDQLFRAQGVSQLLGGSAQIGGFVAGAALVVLVSPAGGIALYAILLAVGSVLAALVSLPSPPSGPAKISYRREFREGWTYFRGAAGRGLRELGAVELLRGFFAAAPALLITAVASLDYGGQSESYGILFAAYSVGGVASALVLAELNPRRTVGRLLGVLSVAGGALLFFATLTAASLPVSSALWFLFGGAWTGYIVSRSAFLQGAYPAGAIGRITSNIYLFTGTSSSVGALVLGAWIGGASPDLLAAAAALGLGLAGLVLTVRPAVRGLAF